MWSRRDWLATAAALGAAGCATKPTDAQQGAKIERSILISMLPDDAPREEGFRMAVDLGYRSMEARTVERMSEAEDIKDAADRAGLRVHSVMNQAHWRHPISSPDPAEVDLSVAGMEASLRQAKLYGADAVLLVPAVVQSDTTYEQAWERSQAVIRERVLPVAEETGVVVAIEEVWNKFLLTPRDFVQYIDEFSHPLIKAYFDVGNVVHYGVPEHWIDAIGGERLAKIHLKDYSRSEGCGFDGLKRSWPFVPLGEGDVDWSAVRQALDRIGFQGAATVELPGGDRDYLADVAARVDRLLGLSEVDG